MWVCDGQTTDSHDHPLVTSELVRLVVKQKVHLVRSVEDLIAELNRGGRQGLMNPQHSGGRLGKEIKKQGYRVKAQKGWEL